MSKTKKSAPKANDDSLKPTSHRFKPSRLKKAAELGIDVGEVLRRALDKAIAHVSGECPTCGHKKA